MLFIFQIRVICGLLVYDFSDSRKLYISILIGALRIKKETQINPAEKKFTKEQTVSEQKHKLAVV